MQNRLIFNAELYKWNHSSISCLMLGNVLVLHRESRLCPCFDDLRTEHFTSPNSKHYRDKNIPTTAGRTSRRCDRAMLARPRQGAAPSRHGPGHLAPGGVFASTALRPTWAFRSPHVTGMFKTRWFYVETMLLYLGGGHPWFCARCSLQCADCPLSGSYSSKPLPWK